MRLLCFQARGFRWESFAQTLEEGADAAGPGVGEAADCLVVFADAEPQDEDPDDRVRLLRHCLKHIKWLANKRELGTVVLHSFAHLGTTHASPDCAREILEAVAARLRETGYQVQCTPFGHTCAWDLGVFGEGLAKVYKEI